VELKSIVLSFILVLRGRYGSLFDNLAHGIAVSRSRYPGRRHQTKFVYMYNNIYIIYKYGYVNM